MTLLPSLLRVQLPLHSAENLYTHECKFKTVIAKNVEGNTIPGWLTCIPYYNVPRKKSILKDNLEEEKERILSIEHVDLNAGLSLGIRLTL